MSAPISDPNRILLAAELAAAKAKVEFLEQALGPPADHPVIKAPAGSKEPRQKPKQRVLPPDESELPPDNVRPLVAARVEQLAAAKGHIK